MNLELTEEQKLLQKTVREFAEAEVKPRARELDETGHFPRDLFTKAAELGLTGVAFPESEGGAGFDHISYSIVIEEIRRRRAERVCGPLYEQDGSARPPPIAPAR